MDANIKDSGIEPIKVNLMNERATNVMIALRAMVVFPSQLAHFDVARDKSLLALEEAQIRKQPIFIATQKSKEIASPREDDIYRVGVLARIQQIIKLPNDTARVLVVGMERYEIDYYKSTSPYFEVALNRYEDKPSDENELIAIKSALKAEIDKFLKLEHKIPKENLAGFNLSDTKRFVAVASANVFDKIADRQDLLETPDEFTQLTKIYKKMLAIEEILVAEKRIAQSVRESMDKNQKEYYLREQIKAIHAETWRRRARD